MQRSLAEGYRNMTQWRSLYIDRVVFRPVEFRIRSKHTLTGMNAAVWQRPLSNFI